MINLNNKAKFYALLGFLGVFVFSIGAELIYIALSNIIVFNISLSDNTRNLYFSSGSLILVAGLWLINKFRKPKIQRVVDALIASGGFFILTFIGLYPLLNCVNALWFFSFRTDHSNHAMYSYQVFFFQAFFAIGLGTWLLIKGKEYLPVNLPTLHQVREIFG